MKEKDYDFIDSDVPVFDSWEEAKEQNDSQYAIIDWCLYKIKGSKRKLLIE